MPSRVPMLDVTTGTIPERFLPRGLNGTPVGTVVEYAGTGAPLDYILCDGSAISRVAYAELFAVIGTTFGAGDGSTTFNLPNHPAGATLSANASTSQAGTSGADLLYGAVQLSVPPGTWELTGHLVGQSNVPDTQNVSLWNQTTAALVPNSRGATMLVNGSPDAVGHRTRSVIVTLTATTVFQLYLTRNGSSTPSVPVGSGSLANGTSGLIDARRMPYDQAQSVIKYRSNSATGTMEPIKRAVGEISEYAGTVVPTGYLFCDGSLLIRSTFPDLFAAIGTTFNTGGETALQFRLPNRQGRVAVGKDATQTEFDTLGETGGAKTVTLTSSEIPAHTHSIRSAVMGVGVAVTQTGAADGAVSNRYHLANGTADLAAIANTGGGGAHNNLQPYIVLNYIIKAVGEIAAAVAPDMVPYRLIGEMFAFGGTGTPTGTLECDGSAVSRTAYPDLFAAIGTTHGVGDGSTTFNVPDMRGRTIVGQDTSQTEFDTLGETGGTKTVTLDVSQIPSHTHSINTKPPGTATRNEVGMGDSSAGTGGLGTTAITSTGGGGAHNNLQPYAVMRWLIKAVWTAAEVPVNSVHTHRVMNLAGIARGTAAPSGGVDGDLYLKYTP